MSHWQVVAINILYVLKSRFPSTFIMILNTGIGVINND